jgi:hypothetical protein
MDCSFVPKSGKATYGIEYFYNGSASRDEKGLEISIVDVDAKQGYALSVQQIPPARPELETIRIDRYLEHLQAAYPYLPKSAGYIVNDGFYSKINWVDGVAALNLDVIGKLRCYEERVVLVAMVVWEDGSQFAEDTSRTCQGHSAESLAVIRHIGVNLLSKDKKTKAGVKTKRLKAGWNDAYLKDILATLNIL